MADPDVPRPMDVCPDDAAVIARVLDGEVEQFTQIVERYQMVLYRHAVALVLDHDVAADMTQDAFIRAYTHLGTCRDRTRFRAWLFTLLRNRCFDYLKEARRKSVPLENAPPIVDRAEAPDTRVERIRLRQEIQVALMALPAAQREAFLMHYAEGIPYDTMATLLDASVSALKMRVLRAREALVSALQRDDVTETQPVRLSVGRG